MGWLSKLGKIALVAAPYVAAPFTGGASLTATGLTNKAVQKWNEHDAKKAAEKGLAPSKFDKYLGYASEGASLASGLGAFNKLGTMGSTAGNASKNATGSSFASKLGKGNSSGTNFGYAGATGDYSSAAGSASKLGGFSNALNKYNQYSQYAQPAINMLQNYGQGRNSGSFQYQTPNFNPQYGQGPQYSIGPSNQGFAQMRPQQSGYPNQMYQQFGPVMGATDQRNPNLALSINQGRSEAIRNQPWRGGYPVNAKGSDDQLINYNMGPIYPNNGPMPASESQQNYGPWMGGYGVEPERQPWH